MRLYRWNGERWWLDDRGVVSRVGRWLLWLGGWETFKGGRWSLAERLRPEMLTPMSLAGHRVTFFGWGVQWRVRGGYWVWTWRPDKHVYWSPDGTPSGATVWLKGAPSDVVYAHRRAQAESDAFRVGA